MIKDKIHECLKNAIEKIFFEKNVNIELLSNVSFELEKPKEEKFGDLATGVAMVLAKIQKKSPMETANEIIERLDIPKGLVKKIEIAGAGFINFFLDENALRDELMEILNSKDKYGMCDEGMGKRVQVEFVSANPTGPLTVGHGRQAAIGDSISRILEACGYNVTREYYFNDSGNQMNLLAKSVFVRYKELLGESVEFLEDGYHGDYIKEIANKILQKYGETLTEESLSIFRDEAKEIIFDEIKETLKRMGIVFDVYFNESELIKSGKAKEVVDELKKKSLAYEQDGGVWFSATKFGIEKDRVLVKSTGEYTYRLVDIAYHSEKLKRGFDKIIDIFGADHHSDSLDVLCGVKALGLDVSKIEVLLHQFVTLKESGERVRMSKRAATFVTLNELLEEVGKDVVRFFYLMRKRDSHLDFDLELAKKESLENPVYYIQYAYARIRSIIRFAEEKGIRKSYEINLSILKEHEEIKLIKHLIDFPEIVLSAGKQREPQRLTSYLLELAGIFHNFYHKYRVVTENPELTEARISLVKACSVVIKNGLYMIGVDAPERM